MGFLYGSIRDFICGGAEELSIREALRVNNVDCEEAEEFFIKGDEELRGSTVY